MPPFSGKRSYELAARAHHAPVPVEAWEKEARGSQSATDGRDYRLLSLFLTPRQWEIFLLCFAHPLLERDALSILLGMRPKSVQILPADLTHKGFLVCTATMCGGRWQLTEMGLRLLARHVSCHVHRFVRTPMLPEVPLQQRGVAGLLHQIRHTAGMYAFFTYLMKSLAEHPDACVRWWETGALCEHIFVYREQKYHFKPDALACVQVGKRTVRFWLEWDRGTMGVRDLEGKCATYAAYLASRAWISTGTFPPALVYVTLDIAQERRFVKTASALLAHLPAFYLYTTTVSLLATYGVQAAIWQQIAFQTMRAGFAPQESFVPHSPPEHVQRVALFAEEW